MHSQNEVVDIASFCVLHEGYTYSFNFVVTDCLASAVIAKSEFFKLNM